VVEKLSPQVQTPEDVERSLGLPILATIPALAGRDFDRLARQERHPGGYVAARPRSAFTESIRLLRARVSRHADGPDGQIVAVASSLPREGKTTTSLCLARVAAMAGKRVMLLDCDLRSGSLHVLLGCEPKQGILEVLRGDVDWREIVGADQSGAHVIPTAGDCFTPEDIFGSPAMRSLLDQLTREYDLVVLDCPPVLTLAEARDLAALANSTVLVARCGKTAGHALRVAYAELVAGGANVVGVALNGVDIKAPGYSSYGDPLYFGRAQRGTYTSA
jgi:capsular exopolysaccharide synthesis family protein